jgi:hypothetical protein
MPEERIPLTGAKAAKPLDSTQRGMPALDSIHKTEMFKGKYHLIRTTEVDSYEKTPTALALSRLLRTKQPPATAVASAVGRQPSSGDNFGGTDRKAAKLSIANAPTENLKDLNALIASLPSIDTMKNLKIPTSATSNRVKQEMRNIRVSGFLYAASREADNDFHLIVGASLQSSQEVYMTMEISGLPPQNSPAFGPLNSARNAYKKFFGAKLPGAGYHFYQPPIPVTIEGSLFFDATHSSGQRPGPPSLKSRMPTIFEVHPITSIKLGP